MISADYCRLFARYNTWQNASLIAAADTLSEADRWADQGAFFQSIAATFNHLYWGDALLLARINGNERPQDTITHSLTSPADWMRFKSLRTKRDAALERWAEGLSPADLQGDVAWFPIGSAERVVQPKALVIMQLFNHQTHHRGQIHAMLTSRGATPGATDIVTMPG